MKELELPPSMNFVLLWEISMIVAAGTMQQLNVRKIKLQKLESLTSHTLIWMILAASIMKLVFVVNLKKRIEKNRCIERNYVKGHYLIFQLAAIPTVFFCGYCIFSELFNDHIIARKFTVWLILFIILLITFANTKIVERFEDTLLADEQDSQRLNEIKYSAN